MGLSNTPLVIVAAESKQGADQRRNGLNFFQTLPENSGLFARHSKHRDKMNSERLGEFSPTRVLDCLSLIS